MRVLVVEDEPQLRELLRRGLEEDGFSVDSAADGEDGLHRALENGCDAIVLDLMLPKLTGMQVLAALRKRGRTTPVLILTARDAPREKVLGLDGGADDYLTKPFTFAELSARLRALIRRTHGLADSILRIADLEIDMAAHRVVRGGRPIELRAKEYALLELLALNRGRIVSQAEIRAHIYAEDRDPDSNVIDVHMCRLRKRIDRGFDAPLLRTVRGMGYTLEGP